MTNILNSITIYISFSIIATIPIIFGAVEPWVWSIYCLIMIVQAILFLWAGDNRTGLRLNNAFNIMIVTFFLWTLLLCLPFSYQIISFLSPKRAELLSKSWAVTGHQPTYQAISYSPQSALAWWAFLLSICLFCWVINNLCYSKKILKHVVVVMIIIGLLEAIYGLIQALVPSMGVLWVDYIQDYLGTARGTFINRNNFAGFIEMIWPLALGLTLSMTSRVHSIKMALHSDRLNRQALMALCIIVFLLSLILTRSRAGIICGIVGFLVFFTLARPGMRKRSRQVQIMLGSIVVLLTIYTMTIGIGPVVERFFTIGSDGSSRLNIWRDSLPIIRDHPMGIGLGNYEKAIEIYNRSGTVERTIGYAHNDYLQLLVETGWVGFLALTSAMLVFLVKCTRRIRNIDFRRNPLHFYLAVGAFSGIVSIGVHSFFDFNLRIPANCVYFAVLLAILSACTQSGRHASSQPSLERPVG